MMAEYENKELGVKFTLPDTLTVEQQLKFRGALAMSGRAGQMLFIRMWEAAQDMLVNWQCKVIPNPAKFDIKKETSVEAVEIIQWVANTASDHVATIGAIPKNG